MLCLNINALYSQEEPEDTTSVMLEEVTVSALPRLTKLKGDAIEVRIHGTHLADSGTALDVLGKMPFVTKSTSGLEIMGKGAPIIYINGRKMRDQSELERLASARIQSVEVVTTPGAGYDSSANAVIRIRTVKPTGEGISVSDRTTAGYKHYAYLFEQVNLGWRKKGLELYAMLNYENYRERPRFNNITTRDLKQESVIKRSQGDDFTKYPVYQDKFGIDYSLGTHEAGIYYDYTFRPTTSSGTSGTTRYVNGKYTETLDNASDSHRHDRQHIVSAYYHGTVDNWKLAANLDALWQINDRRNDERETSNANPFRDFRTENDVENRLLAANLTCTRPLWRGDLKSGTEVSHIRRTDIYAGNTDFIDDNYTKIKETTTSLFIETTQVFGPLSATAGLRWEHTDTRYIQNGIRDDERSRTYDNLAPSVSLTFPADETRTNISYTRKTTRPAFAQLSSAIKYIDRYSYESGNPGLEPVYRDYVSVSTSWRDAILELEYSSTKNYFMWQTGEYPGREEVTLLYMQNMPRFSAFGAYVSWTPTLFRHWHPSVMAGIQAQDFKLTHCGSILRLSRPMGIFRFNNAVRLPWNIWVNLDLSANTSGNAENLYMKSSWTCDLGLYKSFADDTWSIKVQCNDLFDTWRQEFISYDAISRICIAKMPDTRDLSVTVRYNFNQAKSRHKGEGAGNAEKERF